MKIEIKNNKTIFHTSDEIKVKGMLKRANVVDYKINKDSKAGCLIVNKRLNLKQRAIIQKVVNISIARKTEITELPEIISGFKGSFLEGEKLIFT